MTESEVSPYDSWQWQHRWKDYLTNRDECLLVADALRRAVDLRDALVGGPNEHQETTRALMLVDVLNAALEQVLTERSADGRGIVQSGHPWDLTYRLFSQGFPSQP